MLNKNHVVSIIGTVIGGILLFWGYLLIDDPSTYRQIMRSGISVSMELMGIGVILIIFSIAYYDVDKY